MGARYSCEHLCDLAGFRAAVAAFCVMRGPQEGCQRMDHRP